MNKLNVQAIFDSIDGEENAFGGAGQLTTFIRLKGCNLKCKWCDTKYAQSSNPENWMTADEIIKQVHFSKVTITGGEPILQLVDDYSLVSELILLHHLITIETNGSILPLPEHFYNPASLRYVVDYKTPSSGMDGMMNVELFQKLRKVDAIKFVISDEADYQFAKELVSGHPSWAAKIVFSPTMGFIIQTYSGSGAGFVKMEPKIDTVWPRQLVEMMIRDKVPAQFGLQLHKLLWPGAREER